MSHKNVEINIGILALLIVALLVSVFYNLKPNSSSSQGPKNQEVSFEKKQDCAVYKKQIEDKFEKYNNSEITIEYHSLDRIFYSPTEDSCLFVYSGQFGLKATERYRMLYLEDALSGDILTTATVIEQGKFSGDAQTAFYARVREYEIVK